MEEVIEIISVRGGKYHRPVVTIVGREPSWKPRLMLCGRTLEPLNYFTTALDADNYTGGRLAKYACKQCDAQKEPA